MGRVKEVHADIMELLSEAQILLINASRLIDVGAPRDTISGEIQAILCTISHVIDTVKEDME